MKNNTDIQVALREINAWLAQHSDLTASVDETEELQENCIGEYKAGSVFSKEIIIRVSEKHIRDMLDEDEFDYEETVSQQLQLTVYHEVGHALFEQLIDWSENIYELDAAIEGDFGKCFHDVFFDDGQDEESVVEDFATGFYQSTGSLLERCWMETNKIIN